jgi:deazaflavin-dependent oxidoreductase (nitroreductase family)
MHDAFTRRALTKATEIEITVIGRNTGKAVTLPVWFVHEDDTAWLLPVTGSKKTQWYQNVLKNRTITIKVEEQRAHPHRRAAQNRSECRQRDPVVPTKIQTGNDREVLPRSAGCRHQTSAVTDRRQNGYR